MRQSPLALLALLAGLLLPAVAAGQTPIVLPPGQPITVAWDSPDAGAAGEKAPTGYRFETFRETSTGVVITTVDVPATPTEATLPSTVLPPDGAWLLAVRAFNAVGVSDRSNALPFVRPAVPGAPTLLRVQP